METNHTGVVLRFHVLYLLGYNDQNRSEISKSPSTETQILTSHFYFGISLLATLNRSLPLDSGSSKHGSHIFKTDRTDRSANKSFVPPIQIIKYFSTPEPKRVFGHYSEARDSKLTDIQRKRSQMEESFIDAKNRLLYNKLKNNLEGDRLKEEELEVKLFLTKLREARDLEREYLKLNPEENIGEIDEMYDTVDSDIRVDERNHFEEEIGDEGVGNITVNEKTVQSFPKQSEVESLLEDLMSSPEPEMPSDGITALKTHRKVSRRRIMRSKNVAKIVQNFANYESELKSSLHNSESQQNPPKRHFFKHSSSLRKTDSVGNNGTGSCSFMIRSC